MFKAQQGCYLVCYLSHFGSLFISKSSQQKRIKKRWWSHVIPQFDDVPMASALNTSESLEIQKWLQSFKRPVVLWPRSLRLQEMEHKQRITEMRYQRTGGTWSTNVHLQTFWGTLCLICLINPFEWFSTSGTHKPAVSVLQSLDILLLYGSLAALRQSHLLTGLGQGQIQGTLLGLMLGLSGNLP